MTLLHDMRSTLEPQLGMPRFVADQTQYLVYTGSVAYGVSDDTSDLDVHGFCIPNKDLIFPHLGGEIPGFGTQLKRFEQYQKHHIHFKEKEYDLTIYSIVKFFQLCMENNPNMVDVLFVPQRCVLHCSSIGEMVREKRKLFLHKGSYHKFKGYAFSQLHKMATKEPVGSRKDKLVNGLDYKFGYHLVRLLLEVEQILVEGDLDLERNSEQLKYIRRGECSFEHIQELFHVKEKALEALYEKSSLRYGPDETAIKELLLNCLEAHFGSLSAVVTMEDKATALVRRIRAEIEEAGY